MENLKPVLRKRGEQWTPETLTTVTDIIINDAARHYEDSPSSRKAKLLRGGATTDRTRVNS